MTYTASQRRQWMFTSENEENRAAKKESIERLSSCRAAHCQWPASEAGLLRLWRVCCTSYTKNTWLGRALLARHALACLSARRAGASAQAHQQAVPHVPAPLCMHASATFLAMQILRRAADLPGGRRAQGRVGRHNAGVGFAPRPRLSDSPSSNRSRGRGPVRLRSKAHQDCSEKE